MPAEITLDHLRRRSLFIATPMYDGMNMHLYHQSICGLVNLLTHYQIPHYIHIIANESLIQRARNYCADAFLRSGMTHMIFIDSDIGFEPNSVVDMLALADPHSQFQIMVAPYPKKNISWEKIRAAVNKGFADNDANELEKFVGDFVFNTRATTFNAGQPFLVDEAGTGFMLIQRRALELFADYHSCLRYRPDHARTADFDGSRDIMAYFHCEIDRGFSEQELFKVLRLAAEGKNVRKLANDLLVKDGSATRRYLSEDYFFCQRAREAGIGVWMCPWIKLSHTGRYVFDGDLIATLKAGLSATYDEKDTKL